MDFMSKDVSRRVCIYTYACSFILQTLLPIPSWLESPLTEDIEV